MAQIVARRLAVRQARVRISARHPRRGPLPVGSYEENKSGTRRVIVAACHQTFNYESADPDPGPHHQSKSQIRICIKVKADPDPDLHLSRIRELWRLKIEPWRVVDAHNGGV